MSLLYFFGVIFDAQEILRFLKPYFCPGSSLHIHCFLSRDSRISLHYITRLYGFHTFHCPHFQWCEFFSIICFSFYEVLIMVGSNCPYFWYHYSHLKEEAEEAELSDLWYSFTRKEAFYEVWMRVSSKVSLIWWRSWSYSHSKEEAEEAGSVVYSWSNSQ